MGSAPPLTYGQAAARMNVSERTVRRLVAARALPVTRIGQSRRIPASAIERYLRDHTVSATPMPVPRRSPAPRAVPGAGLEKDWRVWD
jgi:excisionase family DNA binding protein